MLYIFLDDTNIELIQTNKDILGKEKISSSARREISDGLIINGLIVDEEKFKTELTSLYTTGYPKAINDKKVVLAISDKQVMVHRFPLGSYIKESDVSEYIMEEAKKLLPYDPTELDHFYKIVENTTSEVKQVVYTACTKATILHFANIIKSLKLELLFISSKSFAIFELLKSIIGEKEQILYCGIDKKTVEYIVLDAFGPIKNFYKKLVSKSFVNETKTVISELEKNDSIKISKIILGDAQSLEIHLSEVSADLNLPAVKISDFIDSLLLKHKIELETGGQPKMLFANSLGLLLLTHTKAPPNFAVDLKLQTPYSSEIKKEEIEEKNKETTSFEIPQITEKEILPSQVIEYKRTILSQILSNKIILVIFIVVIFLFILLGSFFMFGKGKKISIPFLVTPSVTPQPTLIPTNTPIPTIDPKLKREDLKIAVQNGTEKTGFAKETATFIESKGYKKIAISNADKSDYPKTIIKIKRSKNNYLPLIVFDIKEKFENPDTQDLEEVSSFDVLIILGSR